MWIIKHKFIFDGIVKFLGGVSNQVYMNYFRVVSDKS